MFKINKNGWDSLLGVTKFSISTGQTKLGGGFKDFLFSPLLGEDSQFD